VAASVYSSRKHSNLPITFLWESLPVLVFILAVEDGAFFFAMVNRLFLFLVASCHGGGQRVPLRVEDQNEIKIKGISTALVRVEKGFYIYLRSLRYIYLMHAPFMKRNYSERCSTYDMILQMGMFFEDFKSSVFDS